jgi:hypothetical protein
MTVIGFLTYSHKHTNKYIHVHSTPSSDLKGTLFPIPRLVDPLAVVKVDARKVYIYLTKPEKLLHHDRQQRYRCNMCVSLLQPYSFSSMPSGLELKMSMRDEE